MTERAHTQQQVGAANHGIMTLLLRPEQTMSSHVYKMVELVGSSTTGTDEAIRNAVETAAKTLRHIDWYQVLESRGHVVDGKIAHYQVTLKVAFRLEP